MGLRRTKRFTNPWPKEVIHNHGGGGWVRKKKIPGFTDPWPKKKETQTIMEGGGGTGKKEEKSHVQSLVSCRKSQS